MTAMGEFNRGHLPEPLAYFETEGLVLTGKGKWRTATCRFHNGSDSMRINVASGGWICMSCGIKGGDVLSYHMQVHGLEFVEAAKSLGAWVDDGRPTRPQKPTTLPARAALEVLHQEAMLAAVAAANIAHGINLTDADRARLLQAAGRINRIVELFHG
jgi:hypothetical protein